MHHNNLVVQSDWTKSDHAFQANHSQIKASCYYLSVPKTKNQTLMCDPPLYLNEN